MTSFTKKFRAKTIFCALLVALLFTGCFRTTLPEDTHPVDSQPSTGQDSTSETGETPADEIALLLSQMTLREKVGQLFIVRPDALDATQSTSQILDASAEGVTQWSEELGKMLEQYPVGGIAIFGKNITSPAQITALNAAFQENSTIGLFLCVDEEGGTVSRLANHSAFELPTFSSAATVGQSGNPAQAFSMGSTIGAYLADYGFNLDFAPVADVNTNPDNPIIGDRAFSPEPETGAQMASAMLRD